MIRAEHVYKSFGGRPILENVSIHVAPGEFVSIMGKSGSGKSTLLSIIGGNLTPDKGEVMLCGRQMVGIGERELSKLRRTDLGFVYQDFNLVPTLNLYDNLLLPLTLDGKKSNDCREELLSLSKELAIDHLFKSFPESLSGGERQRAAIARAMLHHPKVLLLDEPTGSLDNQNTEAVMELLQKLHREHGVTVVQVTHSAACADYGQRTVYLSDGKVVERL